MREGVYLVGAGPGDKKLITVKGLELLQACDAVVYDNLANPALLNETKPGCKKIYVGKKAGSHTMKQEAINQLLVDLSRSHRLVVRLKGGDPYVFGRGSEEGAFLGAAGVPFEVVPGITSAIGGLAYAGIPVTARNLATSFHVVTGHIGEGSLPVRYDALAQVDGTLVFLMGVGNVDIITRELMAGGRPGSTPAAIVYKATTPEQRTYEGTLETLPDIVEKEQVRPPALIVVGEVVGLRRGLENQSRGLLAGASVVVASSGRKRSHMAQVLEAHGAYPIEVPAIRFLAMNEAALALAIEGIGEYKGILFTSAQSAAVFLDRLLAMGKDLRSLHGRTIIAMGRETARTLQQQGILADVVPEVFSGSGILDMLAARPDLSGRYLIPRSAQGDDAWILKLEAYIEPHVVVCYDTVPDEETAYDPEAVKSADYIAFTSSSAVRGFLRLLERDHVAPEEVFNRCRPVAIGPATARTMASLGIPVALEAQEHTLEGMASCMIDEWNGGNKR